MISRCLAGGHILLREIRGYLDQPIPSGAGPLERERIGTTLDMWSFIIDLVEQYESQENDAIWCQQRNLIEEFISCLIPENIFPLVVKSDIVKNIDPIFTDDWFFLLDSRCVSSISHWCLCSHEAAHLPDAYPTEPIFAPNLTLSLHVHAEEIWSGEFPNTGPGWFTEILCDLWGCYQTGPAYLWGAIEYFPSASPNLDSGDLFHPPPNLRYAMMFTLLKHLDYPTELIPQCPSLANLLPSLSIEDPIGDFSSITPDLFRRELIDYVEQLSRVLLNDVQNRKSEILQSYDLLSSDRILGTDLVADISALAIFCMVQRRVLLTKIIEQYLQ